MEQEQQGNVQFGGFESKQEMAVHDTVSGLGRFVKKEKWPWKMFVVLTLIGLSILITMYAMRSEIGGNNGALFSDGIDSHQNCNVVGLDVHGGLFTYIPSFSFDEPNSDGESLNDVLVASQDIVAGIFDAEHDPSILGIFVEIDSGGGDPVAGEEIANALRQSTKPTVAIIRQMGASAAYWAATGADRIFASKLSDIGSIGGTASYVYYDEPGKQYIELSSGKFKNTGDPDKPLTAEERSLIMRDLTIIKDAFVQSVALNRSLPMEQVSAIADGSTVLGERAKELGLIDEIGSWKEAEAYLESQIGEKPSICWY